MPDEIVLDLDGQKGTEELVIGGQESVLPDGPLPSLPGQAGPKRTTVVRKLGVDNGMDEKERVAALYRRFLDARDARSASGVEDEWAEAERLYNQEDDLAVEGEWRSDAFVPHATREVNNAVPHMVSAVVDSDRLVRLGAPNEHLKDYAELEEEVLNFQMTQRMRFPTALEMACKQSAMLGTGVLFTGFKIERRTAFKSVEKPVADGLIVSVKEKVTIVTDAYNVCLPLDITDIWVDPQATPMKQSRVYYYERKSKRQMVDQGLPYKNLDKLQAYPPTVQDFLTHETYGTDDDTSIGSRHRSDQSNDNLDEPDRLHHLLHEWDYEKRTWSVIADGDIELLAPRPWPTDQPPFAFIHYDFAPGNRFYGRGVIAPVAKSCRNANRLRRSRDDNVELCLSKMLLVRAGAVTDEQEEFVWRPGGVIHVRGGSLENAVKVLEMGDVTGTAYQDERIIKQDIEDVNGIGSIAAGVPDSRAKTATGTMKLSEMVVLRLRGPIRHLMEAMRQVVESMIANNQKFASKLDHTQMLGPIGRLYGLYKDKYKDGAKCMLTVHPANLYSNAEVVNAQVMNAVNIIGSLGMMNYIDPKKLVVWMLKKVGGLHDTDILFKDSEQSYTSGDFMNIMAEQQMIMAGQQVPPKPTDDHRLHMELHTKTAGVYPDFALPLEEHRMQHELLLAQQMMQMQGASPAGLAAGGTGAPARPGMATRDLPQSSGSASSGASMAGNAGAATARTEVASA